MKIDNLFLIIISHSNLNVKKFLKINNLKKKNYLFWKTKKNNNLLNPGDFDKEFYKISQVLSKIKCELVCVINIRNNLIKINFENFNFKKLHFNFFQYTFYDYPIFTNVKIEKKINSKFSYIYGKKKNIKKLFLSEMVSYKNVSVLSDFMISKNFSLLHLLLISYLRNSLKPRVHYNDLIINFSKLNFNNIINYQK